MSEALLFGIGFVVFIAVTTAVLMFGYARFNELYGQDRARGDGPDVHVDGTVEFYAASGS